MSYFAFLYFSSRPKPENYFSRLPWLQAHVEVYKALWVWQVADIRGSHTSIEL